MTKKLIVPKINRNNFLSHCKSVFDNVIYKGEHGINEIKEKKDICIIELIDDINLFSNEFLSGFKTTASIFIV